MKSHLSLVAGLLALAGSLADAAPQTAQRPNVVVFLIDDMGWSDLGCTGSDLHLTPNIDRLAREGVRFTRAYSACTVCSPTRAALMTGKYPARLHITDWIHGHKQPNAKLAIPAWTEHLPHEEVTIAEALKSAGYATGHVGKWHLGDKEDGWPKAHGFDVNLGGCGKGQPPSYFSPYKIPSLADGAVGEYLTVREADEAVKFIEAHAQHPFFLYVPHHGVHTPLQAPQETIARFQALIKPGLRHTNVTYAAMVSAVDDSVGRVMAALDKQQLTERTLVVFTSDNGGLLRSTDNRPLRAGKGSAYEGGVRVPGIVRWPAVIKPGQECSEPIITCDFYPTLLAAAGAAGVAEHNAGVDGVNLRPLFDNPQAKLDRPLYWHYPHYHPGGATPYSAVRAGDWRLVEFFEDNHIELYNLRDDQSETRDLARDQPEQAAKLREQLHAWRKSVGAQLPTPNPNYKPAAK